MTPESKFAPLKRWQEQILIAILFTVVGVTIMVLFSPWRPMLGKLNDYLGRIGLIILLIAITRFIPGQVSLKNLKNILSGLMIMAIAVSLDWIFGLYLIDSLHVNDNTPAGFALLKLNECVVVLTVVLLLTKGTGGSAGSIYIQRGNLKLGLIIGLGTFLLAAITAIPSANALFGAKELNIQKIIPWLPWILIFILANATMEEVLFRGLFLRKLEPLYGKFFSNFMIALVFTGLHLFASYTTDQYMFIAVLFPLALLWGYIMQKTDAVWASILFHAGMDIHILLGIFSNL
jgi:membrane protease YdiL (CAAX protease family)